MKLCKECKYELLKTMPPGKEYRSCQKLSTPTEVVICINAREKGPCGPDGKLWEHK